MRELTRRNDARKIFDAVDEDGSGTLSTDEVGRRKNDSEERWARTKLLGCQTTCRRFGLSPVGHLKRLQ